MSRIGRSLIDLYDRARGGTAFAIDGLVEPEVLGYWLERGVLGQTSNQTLFLAKVSAGHLDREIAELHAQGKSTVDIFNHLYNQEALDSAQALEQWVKPEDSLAFSRETDATRASDGAVIAEEAQTIQALSPWIFVKLANVGPTPEAIRAMLREAVVRGAQSSRLVNPNITLVFGAHHYLNTVSGFVEGLEAAAREGADISRVRSVNSLFVSRVDTAVDALIDRLLDGDPVNEERDLLRTLRGKTATAQGKKIYDMSRAIFSGERFLDPYYLFRGLHSEIADLRERFQNLVGAQKQRLLIASSGNKQTSVYSELLYVLPFFGPDLGNTLPLKTLQALETLLQSSGVPVRDTALDPMPWMIQNGDTIEAWEAAVMTGGGPDPKSADEVLKLIIEHVLTPCDTTLEKITDDLRDAGAKAFAKDQVKAYEVFEERIETVKR